MSVEFFRELPALDEHLQVLAESSRGRMARVVSADGHMVTVEVPRKDGWDGPLGPYPATVTGLAAGATGLLVPLRGNGALFVHIGYGNEHPRISAYRLGVRADTGEDQTANLHAVFQAAEALGGGRMIELPAGRIPIEGSFSLAGYSSGMIGSLASTVDTAYGPIDGTVFVGVNQTGPVLDFTGYKYPLGQRGRTVFQDFAIEGDGTPGTAKKGIYLGDATWSSSVDLVRITISDTGGAPLHVANCYLSEFHGITVFTPIDCVANNVPYVLLEGANGNRFYGLGIRSNNFDAAVPDCPVGGAVRCLMGASHPHHRSVFYGTWFENLRLPSDAAMVVTQTNVVTFSDTQFFDCFKIAGATNTATARFEAPPTQSTGGNEWRGIVEGRGSVGLTDIIDAGIVISQNGNRVVGAKGWGGNNVVLQPGVQWCYVELGGAESAGNNLGIVDNSGNTTNTLIDGPMGIWQLGARAGNARLTLEGLDVANGYTDLGTVSGNVGLNLTFGKNIFKLTLGGPTTITAITYPAGASGRVITVLVRQDATGGRTLAWPANVGFHGTTPPTLSAGANRTDTFTFVYDSGVWRETGRAIGT